MRRGFMMMAMMGLALAAGRAAPGQGQATQAVRFTDFPKGKEVDQCTVEVEAEVDTALLAQKDVWIGVIPVMAPSSVWLQGTPCFAPRNVRVVYLGLENVPLRRPEKFQVVLLTCPKETFQIAGEVRVTDAIRSKVQIMDSVMITRTR